MASEPYTDIIKRKCKKVQSKNIYPNYKPLLCYVRLLNGGQNAEVGTKLVSIIFDEFHSKYLIDLFYEIRFTTQYKNILGELSIYFENSSEDRIRFFLYSNLKKQATLVNILSLYICKK